MKEELKIQIKNYKKIENHIIKLWAIFKWEIDVVDTYFKQTNL